MPRGKLKPGEKSGKAMAGYFPWEPNADPLSDACPIDLRYLNEKQAGQDGFVHRRRQPASPSATASPSASGWCRATRSWTCRRR